MATQQGNTIIQRRRGTRQQDRLLDALLPAYVSVDEKTLAQNIQFLYQFADLIKLYDPNNSLFGSWQWMLQNDASLVMASIATTSISYMPSGYAKQVEDYQTGLDAKTRENAVAQLFLYTDILAYNLADWVARLQLVPDDQLGLLDRLSELMRTNLGTSLAYWQASLNGITFGMSTSPSATTGRNFYGDVATIMAILSPVLGLPPADQLPKPAFTNLDSYFAYLQKLYQSLYRCNIQVIQAMGPLLQATLQQPNHEAHNTLLLAFEQLMVPAVESLNTITRRHLDFYYRQVLQLSPAQPIPDQVRLLFVLKNGIDSALVPKGTALTAGKGAAGEEMIYLTNQDLLVNKVKIAQFKTVFNAGAAAPTPGQGSLYAAPTANSADGLGGKFPAGAPAQWAPFGTDQSTLAADAQTMVPATVGFALASPVLLMSMGQRTIRLYITLAQDSFTQLRDDLTALSKPGQTLADAFLQFIGKAFMASYSGPKGWVDVSITQLPALFSPDFPLAADTSGDTVQFALPALAPDAAGFWLECALGADTPSCIGYDPALHGPGYSIGTPVLRLLLIPGQTVDATVEVGDAEVSVPVSAYNLLRTATFSAFDIAVKVLGKTDVSIQNDYSILNPQKPFQPLGPAPEWGSNFYIGSPEAFRKRLQSLAVHLEWKNLPTDALGFAAYYDVWNQTYPLTAFHNATFRVTWSVLQGRTWIPLPPAADRNDPEATGDYPLFAWDTALPATNSPNTKAPFSPVYWLLNNTDPANEPLEQEIIGDNVKDGKLHPNSDWSGFDLSAVNDGITTLPATPLPASFTYATDVPTGFIRLTLSAPEYGFGATMYQDVAFAVNSTNIENVTYAVQKSQKPVLVASPKPAFVPTAKAISIDYVAEAAAKVEAAASGRTPIDSAPEEATNRQLPRNGIARMEFAHANVSEPAPSLHAQSVISTITHYQIHPFGITPTQNTLLLPNYPTEGTLYLALSDLNAPQTLTILAQLDENSAADNTPTRPTVQWSYLQNGIWTPFKSTEIIADGTNNFSQSGIIEFTLNNPPTPTGGWFNSVENADNLLWLSATAARDTIATCKVILMDTQAVAATYQLGPSASTHLAQPLPAGAITKMVAPVPAISKVSQPFEGFGGREGEDDQQFYTRVHERLRHKERGITAWDIERILLEAFPAIGLVNCFAHSSNTSDSTSTLHPGQTLVIVFPGGSQLAQPNPYTPKFNLSGILGMTNFLAGLIPNDMKATVSNPPYEFIWVKASVRFPQGLDPGYYLQQLNADLCNHIAPWVQTPDTFNPYDTLLSPALLRGFINGLHYIDSLVEFTVYQYRIIDGGQVFSPAMGDYDYFEPSTPWAILTSDRQHILNDADSTVSDSRMSLGFVVPPAVEAPQPGIGTLSVAAEGQSTTEPNEQEYLVIDLNM